MSIQEGGGRREEGGGRREEGGGRCRNGGGRLPRLKRTEEPGSAWRDQPTRRWRRDEGWRREGESGDDRSRFGGFGWGGSQKDLFSSSSCNFLFLSAPSLAKTSSRPILSFLFSSISLRFRSFSSNIMAY
eukprot:349276-Hanusia_phi.AAC.2